MKKFFRRLALLATVGSLLVVVSFGSAVMLSDASPLARSGIALTSTICCPSRRT